MMMIFGTAQSYAKTNFMKQKWNLKKQGIEYDEKNQWKATLMQQASDEMKSKQISAISYKMKSGQKLTGSDLEYLKAHAPQLYTEYLKIVAEREQYKEELKKCKTKDEVNNLNTMKVQEFMSQIHSVEGSGMSAGAKQAAMDRIQMHMANIQNEHQAFVQSTRYASLKWQKEIDREEAEKEAKIQDIQEEKAAQKAEEKEDDTPKVEDEHVNNEFDENQIEQEVKAETPKPSPETSVIPEAFRQQAEVIAKSQEAVAATSLNETKGQAVRQRPDEASYQQKRRKFSARA